MNDDECQPDYCDCEGYCTGMCRVRNAGYRKYSRAELARMLLLNADEGTLTWRERPLSSFSSSRIWKSWNTRYAGTPALHSLSKRGYYEGALLNTRIPAHQAVYCLTHGYFPKEIDHIDGDPLNNKPENLRDASRAEQMRNRRKAGNNTSGTMGVVYIRDRDRWRATIKYNGRTKYLGKFRSKEDAIAARKAAEQLYHYHENHGRP